jgi:putative membrane protein
MKMINWIMRWVISAISLAIVCNLHIGVEVDGIMPLIMATIVIGLMNSLIRPILFFFTLPLNCLTFGLFGFVLNAFLFAATNWFVPQFHTNILGDFLGPVLMGLLASVLGMFLIDKN